VLSTALHRPLVDGESAWVRDWRDLLLAPAPLHDCAQRLGLGKRRLALGNPSCGSDRHCARNVHSTAQGAYKLSWCAPIRPEISGA
jgi:hypothetical protein